MPQLKQISAWKCIKCGRVLTTEGGRRRHLEKCQYIPPVLDGQIKFEDLKDGQGEIATGGKADGTTPD